VNPRAVDVGTDDDNLTVDLADGRRLTVPLAWLPRLLHASADQRRNGRLMGDSQGFHWLDVDENLSMSGLFRGAAAPGASKGTVQQQHAADVAARRRWRRELGKR
jgi:hypothetical protein